MVRSLTLVVMFLLLHGLMSRTVCAQDQTIPQMEPSPTIEPSSTKEDDQTKANVIERKAKQRPDSLFGDKVSVQVGYKVWMAKWQTFAGVSTQQLISKYEPLQGPSGSITFFDRVFVSGQYLTTNFKFHDEVAPGGPVNPPSSSRNDLTLTGGVRIWKGFGIFAGYYQMLQHFNTGTPDAFSFRIKGPVVGVFGTVPIEDTDFALYANLARGFLSAKAADAGTNGCTVSDCTNNAHAWSGELGVSYAGPTVWKIEFAAQAGFRFQVIEEDFGGPLKNRGNDTTVGPIFMVNAKF